MSRALFLRWALIETVVAVLLAAAAILYLPRLGGAPLVAASGITLVLAGASLYCGLLMWRVDTLPSREGAARRRLDRLYQDAEHVWFTVSLCQILGLLGTVAGFLIVMVGGFEHLTASDPASLRMLLQHVASGSATALIATLVGIFASVVLALEHHLLVHAIERLKAELR